MNIDDRYRLIKKGDFVPPRDALDGPAIDPNLSNQFSWTLLMPAYVRPLVLLIVFAAAAVASLAQTPASGPEACGKNISFAVAESGQPVPAVPKFVANWIGSRKHERDRVNVCFSQVPDGLAQNYIMVFSTTDSTFDGLAPTAHTYTRTAPNLQNAMVTSSHGRIWDYSYSGPVAANNTATASLKLMDKAKVFFMRVYNQHGEQLSRYTVGVSGSKEKMLESAVDDVRNDSQPPSKQKPFAAPMSVYYVNCDVDSEAARTAMLDSSESAPAPSTVQAQEFVIDFWSNATGSDIFVDGGYVGKTPSSRKVAPGEHTITIRKQDYQTWQKTIKVTSRNARVEAYLEQVRYTVHFDH